MFLALVACEDDARVVVPTPANPGSPSETPLPGTQIIEFTDDGYKPANLKVWAGQQVRFVNRSSMEMWPASNIHPSNQVLPEFDPGRPIESGEEWAFTFHEPGFWRYHDHILPGRGGLITAMGDDTGTTYEPFAPSVSPNPGFPSPPELASDALEDLLQNDTVMRQYVRDYGPANTISLMAQASGLTGSACHPRAHQAGLAAHEFYGASAFMLIGHECDSGGYHGVMEAMLRERGTADIELDLKAVCGEAATSFLKLRCLHGVGHGLMAWTGHELYDALNLCDFMISDRERRACYSGVFMANVIAGVSNTTSHSTAYLSDENPHYPCDALTERYVSSCYLYHSTRMLIMFKYNYELVAQECANTRSSAVYDCFESYGRDVAAATLGDPARGIEMCHETVGSPAHRVWCVQGSVQARFWDSSGADEAIQMCRIAGVAEEKNGCYWMIIARAQELYPDRTGLEEFCGRLEQAYRAWCRQ